MWDIDDRGRIIGQHAQDCTTGQRLEAFTRFQDRQRA